MPPPISLLVVFFSAIVNMLIGMAWYSPALFGKHWSSYSGDVKTAHRNKSARTSAYLLTFAGALATAYVLAYFLYYTGSTTLIEGAKKGAMMWAGFVLTTMAGNVLFEGRPKQLLVINSGYQLVSLIITGAILAVWA